MRGGTLGLVRPLVLLAMIATPAGADPIRVSGAVGAGGQGTATYGGLALGVEGLWDRVHIGLGGRLVLLDGSLRDGDWDDATDLVTLIRHVEVRTERVALAAGALTPSRLGTIVDGHRASLDDRPRTGTRAAAYADRVDAVVEIDDVLDPSLIGGELVVRSEAPITIDLAAALDPGYASALELAGARRWEDAERKVEAGASIVAEPSAGLGAVGFARGTLVRGETRWSLSLDARGGNGTNGAAFGPLYRAERTMALADARAGFGAGATAEVRGPLGLVALGARARPGMGSLVQATFAAPMGRHVQAAGWVARSPTLAAGATSVRVTWSRRLYSAFEVARMLRPDGAEWSLTAWFGATRE